MAANIRKLSSNEQGKDYVVGDLHGCYGLLERLLTKVRFDRSRDRLFSVGDLIDRGSESLRCLQLLEEPWFFAVQGNHELMMLNFFLPYLLNGRLESLEDIHNTGFLTYGGDWVTEYFQAGQQTMSAEFNHCMAMVLDLPLVWVVGEGESRFHVIHAELVRPDYRQSQSVVYLDEDLDHWLEQQAIPAEAEDRLLWGRTLMLSPLVQQDNLRMQPGLSPTFCGHTYNIKPRQALSHLCLDTGAFVSYAPDIYEEDFGGDFGLTLYDVKASRWFFTSYQSDEVTCFDD